METWLHDNSNSNKYYKIKLPPAPWLPAILFYCLDPPGIFLWMIIFPPSPKLRTGQLSIQAHHTNWRLHSRRETRWEASLANCQELEVVVASITEITEWTSTWLRRNEESMKGISRRGTSSLLSGRCVLLGRDRDGTGKSSSASLLSISLLFSISWLITIFNNSARDCTAD